MLKVLLSEGIYCVREEVSIVKLMPIKLHLIF